MNLLTLIAQSGSLDHSYGTTSSSSDGSAAVAGLVALSFAAFLIMLIIGLVLSIVTIIGEWKVFQKANKPGWASLVPIYNTVVLLDIVGRPTWWILLFLVPIANIVVSVIVINDLSKSFGRGVGFTALLFFLPTVGLLILGFGKDKYIGTGFNAGGVAPALGGPAELSNSTVQAQPSQPAISTSQPQGASQVASGDQDQSSRPPQTPTPPSAPLVQ